jgi:hypothetical protein
MRTADLGMLGAYADATAIAALEISFRDVVKGRALKAEFVDEVAALAGRDLGYGERRRVEALVEHLIAKLAEDVSDYLGLCATRAEWVVRWREHCARCRTGWQRVSMGPMLLPEVWEGIWPDDTAAILCTNCMDWLAKGKFGRALTVHDLEPCAWNLWRLKRRRVSHFDRLGGGTAEFTPAVSAAWDEALDLAVFSDARL